MMPPFAAMCRLGKLPVGRFLGIRWEMCSKHPRSDEFVAAVLSSLQFFVVSPGDAHTPVALLDSSWGELGPQFQGLPVLLADLADGVAFPSAISCPLTQLIASCERRTCGSSIGGGCQTAPGPHPQALTSSILGPPVSPRRKGGGHRRAARGGSSLQRRPCPPRREGGEDSGLPLCRERSEGARRGRVREGARPLGGCLRQGLACVPGRGGVRWTFARVPSGVWRPFLRPQRAERRSSWIGWVRCAFWLPSCKYHGQRGTKRAPLSQHHRQCGDSRVRPTRSEGSSPQHGGDLEAISNGAQSGRLCAELVGVGWPWRL